MFPCLWKPTNMLSVCALPQTETPPVFGSPQTRCRVSRFRKRPFAAVYPPPAAVARPRARPHWAAEDTREGRVLPAGAVQHSRLALEDAGAECEVLVSRVWNPRRCEPGSECSRYPLPEPADEKPYRAEGVDLIFRPAPNEMYFDDRSTFVEETALSERLCGERRPGHFRGVTTVVTKLFHLVAPDAAVFGEKDFQQLAIVRRMVRDLNFPIQILAGATVREVDGIALSSRNPYLSAEERAQAPVIRAARLDASRSEDK